MNGIAVPSLDNIALVLGADGFLGSHFSRCLRERGWTVHEVGRREGDLADWPNVAQIFQGAPPVSRIFHFVTRQRTGQVQYGIQGELIAINSRIHLNVLEAWRLYQPQAKLVSTGSSCAFPSLTRPIAETDFQGGPLHESVRGYGLAKQLLAVGSECYSAQYGLTYLHLFLATLYGPRDHKEPERAHFMAGMIDRAVMEKRAGERRFTVWGSPETTRDLLYVEDQIAAILAADSAFANCSLNCTSNAPVTIHSVALAIREALAWDAEIVYPPNTFKGADYKTLDSKAFLTKTDWQPQVSIAEGVNRVLASDY